MTRTAFLSPAPLLHVTSATRLTQTRAPKPLRPRAPARMCTTSTPDEPDDDDTSFGKMEAEDVYGMQMPPNVSEADKDYLDAAKNGDEFLARLAEIARRMDIENRRATGKKRYAQTNDYFDNISKKE